MNSERQNQKYKILIVEDSAIQSEMLRRLLSDKGYGVSIATNGLEGLEAAKKEKPDIILSDIMMPMMDGYEMCRELKNSSDLRNIPIILLTQLTETEDVINGLESGAEHFITKPVDEDSLLSKITVVIKNPDLYNNNPSHKCIDFEYNGKRYEVHGGRVQTLSYLVSSYEDSMLKNRNLETLQAKLVKLNEDLEEKVKERTVALIEEIEYRKKTEEMLKDNEERYKRLIESVTDYIYTVQVEDGRPVKTTHGPACAAITGYASEDYEANPDLWFDMVYDEDKEAVWEQAEATLSGNAVPLEHRIISKGGKIKWVRNMPVPHYDEKGRLISYDGLISDITERKKAEDSLRKSENKYRTLLEHLPQKIFYKDRNSVYISCNKNYANDLRINLDEIIGKTDYEFFPKELVEKYRADDKRLMNLDRTEEMEEKYVLDGKEYFVHTIKTPIKDDKGNTIGVMGIFRDITEHKKLEDQLRHAQKMEAIGTLAGGIAHDFNNILNVIMGFGSIVMDMLGDDHVAKGHMKEVIVAAERAVHLTKRLLLFSRKAVAEFKPVDVNEMIINMEKMLSQIIGEDINFVTDLMGAKAMVMADAGQMEQVLINLATNARDAMPKGGKLTISTEIKEVDDAYIAVYGYGKTGTYALISVTDTGTGMDAETQEKIFEPFFTTKGVGEGTGLGLAIAYGIIKQHDGYIKVYSKEGKGTTFKILLPVIEEAKARGQEIEAAVPAKGGTETILVAEDDAALRKLAKIVLESSGYTVITAEDGEEAITKYMGNRDKIQLVVLDMIMPKKSGKEAYDEIKKISPDVKALFASGYTMDIITKKELLGEDMEIVVKPIPSKDLLRKVREILDR